MPITQVTNHEQQAIALLLQQFRSKAAIEDLVAALSVGLNTSEDTLFDLLTRLDFSAATGVQLDGIGGNLNAARQGATDANYRLLMQQEISLHGSHGIADELLEISRLSTFGGGGGGVGVFIEEEEDAPGEFTAFERSDAGAKLPGSLNRATSAAEVFRLLNKARAGGRNFVFIWGDKLSTLAVPTGFRFDTGGKKFDGGSRWRLDSRGAESISSE